VPRRRWSIAQGVLRAAILFVSHPSIPISCPLRNLLRLDGGTSWRISIYLTDHLSLAELASISVANTRRALWCRGLEDWKTLSSRRHGYLWYLRDEGNLLASFPREIKQSSFTWSRNQVHILINNTYLFWFHNLMYVPSNWKLNPSDWKCDEMANIT